MTDVSCLSTPAATRLQDCMFNSDLPTVPRKLASPVVPPVVSICAVMENVSMVLCVMELHSAVMEVMKMIQHAVSNKC